MHTPDDTVSSYTDYGCDVNGNQMYCITYRNNILSDNYNTAGLYGIWLTADDGVSLYSTYEYDAKNKIHCMWGKGLEGTWFTGDDIVSFYYLYVYESQGALGRTVSYSQGVDIVWFTSDDEVSYCFKRMYDNKGNVIVPSIYYQNARNDGIWFTGNDVAQGEVRYIFL